MGLIAEVVGVARRALVRWWKRLLRRRSEPRRPRRGRPRVVSEVARDAIRGKYVAKHGQWGPAVLACWARREGLGSFSPTTVSRLVSDLRPTPDVHPSKMRYVVGRPMALWSEDGSKLRERGRKHELLLVQDECSRLKVGHGLVRGSATADDVRRVLETALCQPLLRPEGRQIKWSLHTWRRRSSR